MRSRIGAALTATLFWAFALVAPAHATFPGENGKITFFVPDDVTGGIWVADPGATPSQLFAVVPPRIPVDPGWSADGRRVV